MPTAVLETHGPWEDNLVAKLNKAAKALSVTATALKWRLVATGKLSSADAKTIPDASLRNHGGKAKKGKVPPLFSKPFMEVITLAIDEGRISLRKAADLLDTTTDELSDLCRTHGVGSTGQAVRCHGSIYRNPIGGHERDPRVLAHRCLAGAGERIHGRDSGRLRRGNTNGLSNGASTSSRSTTRSCVSRLRSYTR